VRTWCVVGGGWVVSGELSQAAGAHRAHRGRLHQARVVQRVAEEDELPARLLMSRLGAATTFHERLQQGTPLICNNHGGRRLHHYVLAELPARLLVARRAARVARGEGAAERGEHGPCVALQQARRDPFELDRAHQVLDVDHLQKEAERGAGQLGARRHATLQRGGRGGLGDPCLGDTSASAARGDALLLVLLLLQGRVPVLCRETTHDVARGVGDLRDIGEI